MRHIAFTIRLFAAISALILATSCSWNPGPAPDKPRVAAETVSAVPFPVKDPEKFSADVIVRTVTGDETLERKYFIAKNGAKMLQRFGVGTKSEFWILNTGRAKAFRLRPDKKEYEELERLPVSTEQDSLITSLTNRWLNEKRRSGFTDLGNSEGLHKYQSKIDDSKNTEILIYVDEQLKYPVRQEFYTVAGEKKELVYSVTLENLSTEPKAGLFEIPEGFRAADAGGSK